MQNQQLIDWDDVLAVTGQDAETVRAWIAAGKLRAHNLDNDRVGYDRAEVLEAALAWERACHVPLLLQLGSWINSAVKRKQTADKNHLTWLDRADEWEAKEAAYELALCQRQAALDDLAARVEEPARLVALQRELEAANSARRQLERDYAREHALSEERKQVLGEADSVFTHLKQEVARLTQEVAQRTKQFEYWHMRGTTAEMELELLKREQRPGWIQTATPVKPVDAPSPRWRRAFLGIVGTLTLLVVMLFFNSGMGVLPRDARDVKVSTRGAVGSRCARMTDFATRLSPEKVMAFYHRHLMVRGWWRDRRDVQPGIAPQDVYHRWWDRAQTGQTLEVMVLSTDGSGRSNVTLMTCEGQGDQTDADRARTPSG
jgi:hypothetical protein